MLVRASNIPARIASLGAEPLLPKPLIHCPKLLLNSGRDSSGSPELSPISVVVPVYNDAANLALCLEALAASTYPEFEIVVVNDGSDDASSETAQRHGAQLIQMAKRSGPSAARNRGAQAARHPYILFVDADVCVQEETLRLVAEVFADSRVDALFGSYDRDPGAPNLVSQYRNLLHCYVHQTSDERSSSFWTGCGAIKRSIFLRMGGLRSYDDRPSIEDIEFGARLSQAGYRVVLAKHIQVRHMKRWSLWRMIQCDVIRRGIPWTLLLLEQGRMPNDLNLKYSQRASVLLSAGLLLAFGIALLGSGAMAASGIHLGAFLAVACLSGILMLNSGFYLFLARVKHPLFVPQVMPLHLLYFLYSGFAFAAGTALFTKRAIDRYLAFRAVSRQRR